jgi:hypothetical protein
MSIPFGKKVLEKIFAKPLDKSKYRPAAGENGRFLCKIEKFL